MIATTVMVQVKPEFIEDFKRECIRNHENSVKEPGNLRFDILQSKEEPAMFMLYEAYTDEQSAAAHKKTAHYEAWRDAVAQMMAVPRKGIPYNSIKP